jgi:PKD repeat protein
MYKKFISLTILVSISFLTAVQAQESYIIVHALNPEGVEIASVDSPWTGLFTSVEIFDSTDLIGYAPHNEETHNVPIPIESGTHTIKAKFNGMTKEQTITLAPNETKTLTFVFDRVEFDITDWIRSQDIRKSLHSEYPIHEGVYTNFKDMVVLRHWSWSNIDFENIVTGTIDTSFYFDGMTYETKQDIEMTLTLLGESTGWPWSTGAVSEISFALGELPTLGLPSPRSDFDEWYVQRIIDGYTAGIYIAKGTNYDDIYWLTEDPIDRCLFDDSYLWNTIPANVSFTNAGFQLTYNPWYLIQISVAFASWDGDGSGTKESHRYDTGTLDLRMSSVPYDLLGTGIKDEKNQPPDASFSYSPEKQVVNKEITFNASSSYDPDGEIVSYEWDFGDGSSGSGQIVTHAYTKVGEYNVSLTVTDNDGLTDSSSLSIKVTGKEFMITFDDGPLPGATESIIEGLNGVILDDGKPVRAGFFMVGCNDGCEDTGAPKRWYGWLMPFDQWTTKGSVHDYASTVRAVALMPADHIIGNHTQHHMWFWWWLVKPKDVKDEIAACQKELEDVLAQVSRSPGKVFRPPYFVFNSAVDKGASGYQIIMGAGDNRGEAVDASGVSSVGDIVEKAANQILNWTRDEPCVLVFHDASPITPYNIGDIVRALQEKGFTLVHFDPARISGPTREEGTHPLTGGAYGPVNLEIIDPDGLILSKEENQIPNAHYEEFGIDEDIDLNNFFVIQEPKLRPYRIKVLSESKALPRDKYSIEVHYSDKVRFLAKQVQIRRIPLEGYVFSVIDE